MINFFIKVYTEGSYLSTVIIRMLINRTLNYANSKSIAQLKYLFCQ